MIESGKWTRVPATKQIEIYPVIRKPSVTCSNSLIFRCPRCVLIIDPGTDVEQIEEIKKVVHPLIKETEAPVYIFFTHCHIDHYLATPLVMDEPLWGKIVCHWVGAGAMESKDETLTLANMNGSVLPECTVYARLFDNKDPIVEALSFQRERIRYSDDVNMDIYHMEVGDDDIIDVISTPGHSPDGLSYRVGDLFIIGDLLLATSAGIAGKAGWDNEKLAESLSVIKYKIMDDDVSSVIPGHGSPFPVEKAQRIIEKTIKTARGLKDLASLDRLRANYLSDYAVSLLEEAGNIFSIIAGRLLKVSYFLELLDESEKAQDLLLKIDSDAIDEMVGEFHDFVEELKVWQNAPIIAKGVQFVRKVDKIFSAEEVGYLLDKSLISRIKNILTSFLNVIYGVSFKDQETLFEMSRCIKELLHRIQKAPYRPDSILDSVENNDHFLDELSRRIAYQPLFESFQFYFNEEVKPIEVTADRSIFEDMVTALMEQFAIAGIKSVNLRQEVREELALLIIGSNSNDKNIQLRDSKAKYLNYSMQNAGGGFRINSKDGNEEYIFEISLAGK